MKSQPSFLIRAALLLLLALGFAGGAAAQTWTNNSAVATIPWSGATNWVGGTPSAGGGTTVALIFGGFAKGTTAYSSSNDFTSITPFALNVLTSTNGALTLNGGQLLFTNNGTTGPVITNSSGASLNINNALVLGNHTAITTGNSTTIPGVISGVGALTRNGSASMNLALSATNTYSGGTTNTAGYLTINNGSSLGTGPLTWVGGNYLASTATCTLTNAINLVGNLTSTVSSGTTLTLGGVLTNTGTLTLNGPGTLLLTNVNTYTNVTTVTSGTLGGSGTIAGPVVVNAGTFLSPSAGLGGSNTLTLSSSATNALTLNNGAVVNFALAPNGAALTNDNIQITGSLVLNNANYVTLSFPQGTAPAGSYTLMTYANTNGSTGTLSLLGSYPNATLTVGATSVTLTVPAGTNTYTTLWKGQTNGTWNTTIGNWTNGAGGGVYYNEGDAVTFDDTASKFIITNGAVSPGSVTFNNSTKNYTNAASIGGSGALIKLGTGSVTLSGADTYTGPTMIDAGALLITTNGSLGTSAVTVNSTVSGALSISNGATVGGNVALGLSSANNVINYVNYGTNTGTLTIAPPLAGGNTWAQGGSAVAGYAQLNGGSSNAAIVLNGRLDLAASPLPVNIGVISGSNTNGAIYVSNTNNNSLVFQGGSSFSALTPSVNNAQATVSQTGGGGVYFQYWGISGSSLGLPLENWTFNGGTWTLNQIGYNGTGTQDVGTNTLTSGAVVTIIAQQNYSHGTWNVNNGTLNFSAAVVENNGNNTNSSLVFNVPKAAPAPACSTLPEL